MNLATPLSDAYDPHNPSDPGMTRGMTRVTWVPGRSARMRSRDLAARPGREGEIHRALQAIAARDSLLISRRFSDFRRRISGYALDRLLPSHGYDVARFLSGTEGSLAVPPRATVNLVELPAATALLALGFNDSVAAADCVPLVLPHGPLTMSHQRHPGRPLSARAGMPGGGGSRTPGWKCLAPGRGGRRRSG